MKTYYKTRIEALEKRNIGDRIYYDAVVKAYYLATPTKRSFWRLK